MNTYQAQPHGRFSSNSTLVVTPNIKPELKIFQKTIESKVDSSLDDWKKKIAELEELIKSLTNKNLSIAPLDRDKAQILHPLDIIRKQTSKGYYEIPYDCYLEACLWSYNTAMFINVPHDDATKTAQDFIKQGVGSRSNWWATIAAMNKWKLIENTSGQISDASTICSKGDHLILTWGYDRGIDHLYWKPLNQSGQWGNITYWGSDTGPQNSLSYIKMIPFK